MHMNSTTSPLIWSASGNTSLHPEGRAKACRARRKRSKHAAGEHARPGTANESKSYAHVCTTRARRKISESQGFATLDEPKKALVDASAPVVCVAVEVRVVDVLVPVVLKV